MRINRIRKRRLIIYLIALFALGVGLFSFGFKESEQIIYKYQENNNVDYKVFLKQNNFFDTPYLEKNKTYITSLIDYIDADFSYNIHFNEPVSGKFKYKMFAQIRADKINNDIGNYWTKEYDLSEEQANIIANKNSHEIKVKQTIKYNQYNDLLNSFIKEYGIQTESTVKVYMKVKGIVRVNNTNEEMNIDSEVSLVIPLSKLAVEGKIETQNNNNEKEIVKTVQDADIYSIIAKVAFIIDVAVFIYYLYRYVIFSIYKNKYLCYADKIKKINMDYEEIITKVKNINLNDFAIINVESFDDLINIYTSIREPINFLYETAESKYFIINGNTCYLYTIYKEVESNNEEEN